MSISSRKTWIRGIGVAMILSVVGAAAWAEGDMIKTREADMKTMGKQLKTIKAVIDAGGKAGDVIDPANKVAEIAGEIPTLFPVGSDKGKTEANPNIWQTFDDFKTHAATLQTQAQMLASAGQSGDLATVRAQFDKVAAACGSCHKVYRHKEN